MRLSGGTRGPPSSARPHGEPLRGAGHDAGADFRAPCGLCPGGASSGSGTSARPTWGSFSGVPSAQTILLKQAIPRECEEVPWAGVGVILVLARFWEPDSELHIAERSYRQTALPERQGIPVDAVNKDRLYRGLDAVRPHKLAIDRHLLDVTLPLLPSLHTACTV